MSCHTCGSINNVQLHHDQYYPPITRSLCVKCHKELHNHGVGRAPGYTLDEFSYRSIRQRKPIKVYDRSKNQGDLSVALHRIKFCLNQLEKHGFKKEVKWETEIAHHLTVEECIGALVAAEQNLETHRIEKGRMILIE